MPTFAFQASTELLRDMLRVALTTGPRLHDDTPALASGTVGYVPRGVIINGPMPPPIVYETITGPIQPPHHGGKAHPATVQTTKRTVYFSDIVVSDAYAIRGDADLTKYPFLAPARSLLTPASAKSYWIVSAGMAMPAISAPLPNVYLAVFGSVTLFELKDFAPKADAVSNSGKPPFRVIDFTAAPLVFQAVAVPARYRVSSDGKTLVRMPDTPTLGLAYKPNAGENYAIDLVLKPILSETAAGPQNPFATTKWNSLPDNKLFLSILENLAPPVDPPEIQGIRHSRLLFDPILPNQWPFNAGLSVIPASGLSTEAFHIGYDLEAAPDSAVWVSDWLPFFQSGNTAYGWPLTGKMPPPGNWATKAVADAAVWIGKPYIISSVMAALQQRVVGKVLTVAGFDFRATNPSVSWPTNKGLTVTLDLQVRLAFWWVTLGSASIVANPTIDVTTPAIDVLVGGQATVFGFDFDATDLLPFLGANIKLPGATVTQSKSGLTLSFAPADFEEPHLGTLLATGLATDDAVHIYTKLDQRPFDLGAAAQLAIDKGAGHFIRDRHDGRKLTWEFTVANGGRTTIVVYGAVLAPDTAQIVDILGHHALPAAFFKCEYLLPSLTAPASPTAPPAVLPPGAKLKMRAIIAFPNLPQSLSVPVGLLVLANEQTALLFPDQQPTSDMPVVQITVPTTLPPLIEFITPESGTGFNRNG